MNRRELNFSTNAKLEKLIGRELITNNTIAIFELIKNSYDAFSKEVTIEFENFDTDGSDKDLNKKKDTLISNKDSRILIKDNGIGMTYEELLKNWMVIGTTNKENTNEINKNIEGSNVKRFINGEKGIGRFGTDRLGSQLKLITRAKKDDGIEQSDLDIDWELFDDHEKQLAEIKFICNVSQHKESQISGLNLDISNLRDKWTGSDLLNIKKQLRKFLSPFKQEQQEFQIFLIFENRKEIIINDSLEYADVGIEGELTSEGQFTYKLFDKDFSERKEIAFAGGEFGSVKFRILYMDGAAKRAFTRKNGIATREYGNIKIFRDDFRILPYGEKENDWLGIDNKHAQAVFRSFGTRDIIGYVQITRNGNSELKDATSRQGLNEDTEEFKQFKKFIWHCLMILQDYVFNRIKREARNKGQVIVSTVMDMQQDLIDVKKIIKDEYDSSESHENQVAHLVKQKVNKIENSVREVDRANKTLQDRVNVMEKIVGTETMLYDLLHTLKNKMESLNALVYDIQSQSNKLGLNFQHEIGKQLLDDMEKIIQSGLYRTSPRRAMKKNIEIENFMRNYLDEKRLIYPEIDFRLTEKSGGVIRINVDGLRNSLDNLLSNSNKAFTLNKKIIHIEIMQKNNKILIVFEDNGSGVPEDIKPFIFNVSSTSTEEGGGTGLGLTNVYQYMKGENGDISLLKESILGGAGFLLEFPMRLN